MMRITAYADRLLEDLDRLNWPESVKTMQRNWIGRSEGTLISFQATNSVPDSTQTPMQAIEVFTTRPDTLFGTTYMVLAPEHALVDELAADAWLAGTPESWTGGAATPREAVAAYRARTAELSDGGPQRLQVRGLSGRRGDGPSNRARRAPAPDHDRCA